MSIFADQIIDIGKFKTVLFEVLKVHQKLNKQNKNFQLSITEICYDLQVCQNMIKEGENFDPFNPNSIKKKFQSAGNLAKSVAIWKTNVGNIAGNIAVRLEIKPEVLLMEYFRLNHKARSAMPG